MRKEKWIACILSLSLLLLSVNIDTGRKSQASAAGIQTFERITTGQNNGLLRYQYVDNNGSKLQLPSGGKADGKKRASVLPSSYNSCENGVVTPIKNQGITGGCWAFGALKALESSSIVNGLSALEDTDYSENHLLWYTYTPLEDASHPLYGDYTMSDQTTDSDIYDYGGNALIAAFTLANGWGAVSEDTAPFSADTAQDVAEMAAGMKNAGDSLRFRSDVHLTEANCYDTASLDEIKQAVMDYGSLDVAMYYDYRYHHTENEISSYYQNRKDSSHANHCVTIVGWDDSFDNFLQPAAPQKSGAWLIANSYGEEDSMDGYFWLSYYDTSLCEFYSYEGVPADRYDSCFQYDGNGWNIGYIDTDDIALANIFANTEDAPRQLDAVSFYTVADGQDYRIEVYRNVKSSPTDGEPLSKCTVSGTAQRNGYHTIPLNDSFAVAPGERFSIVITFPPGTATDNITYALVEGESNNTQTVCYQSSPGQSFVYFASTDTWYDNTAVPDEETGTIQNNNNVCVKAHGNTITEQEFAEWEKNYIPETPVPSAGNKPGISIPTLPAPSPAGSTPTPGVSARPAATVQPDTDIAVTVKNSRLVLGQGETVSLPITTRPASAKKQLQYTSSNKNTATVNSSGKVTGTGIGKAAITISGDGVKQQKITIVVKRKPSSVRLKAGKTTIKKGKTTKLKTILSSRSASYRITYRSSRPKVASVSGNGDVKGKKKGVTWITVRTYNKKTARIKIRVIS